MKRMLFFLFLFVQMAHAEERPNLEKQCPELTGRVVAPSDPSFDQARLVSNYYSSKNKRPKLIVYCRSTEEVQNAVKWASCQNIPIRVRSGGHNHEGFSTGQEALVIDVSEMKKIEIDTLNHLARVQPGVTGGQLYEELFRKGLTQVGGTCKEVGVSGLVLTGGMGPLARRFGLACDNLLSLEIVDAKGNVSVVTPNNEYRDLFWACCGAGGGNFGVVTSLVIRVHPAQKVTWFNIGWDWDQPVEQVISAWQELFLTQENKIWFSHLDLWSKAYPSKKFNKQPIKALGVYYGSPEEAKRGLQPLLNSGKPTSIIDFVSWDQAVRLFEESTSTFITNKPEYKSTGAFAMAPLPQEAVHLLTDTLRNSSSPLLNVLFLCLGGAVKERPSDATAYFYREAKCLLTYSTQWLKESEDLQKIGEVDRLRERLLPYTQGDYVGNPDLSLNHYLTAYYGRNVAKLQAIKQKYDPNNLFQFEQGLSPQ